MKDILKITLRLFAVTLIAAVLLGATYAITKEPIARQEAEAAEAARREVLPEAAEFAVCDISALPQEYAAIAEVYTATDADGAPAGATVLVEAKGYNPGIILTVGIKPDGTVSKIDVGSNEETPGLGAKAAEPEFYEQFSGQAAPIEVVKNKVPSEGEIEAISGATKTSAGITAAVNLAVRFYAEYIGI